MKMVSLKMTPQMRKKSSPEVATAKDSGPEFPWGSRLTFEDSHVEALGLSDTKSDDTGILTARFRVIGSRSEDRAGGKKSRSVEVQLTDCAVDVGGKSSPRDLGIGPKAAKRMEGM